MCHCTHTKTVNGSEMRKTTFRQRFSFDYRVRLGMSNWVIPSINWALPKIISEKLSMVNFPFAPNLVVLPAMIWAVSMFTWAVALSHFTIPENNFTSCMPLISTTYYLYQYSSASSSFASPVICRVSPPCSGANPEETSSCGRLVCARGVWETSLLYKQTYSVLVSLSRPGFESIKSMVCSKGGQSDFLCFWSLTDKSARAV